MLTVNATWCGILAMILRVRQVEYLCHQQCHTTTVISHYGHVVMRTLSSQITSLTIVYSNVYSGADQRKHQSSASLAFVRGIHRGPVNSPQKLPVTRKMFPFDDVIMQSLETPPHQPFHTRNTDPFHLRFYGNLHNIWVFCNPILDIQIVMHVFTRHGSVVVAWAKIL